MSIRVLVLLAEGFEEIEAVTAIDVLRRAGADVVAAGLAEGPIRASRGLVVVPDTTVTKLPHRPHRRFSAFTPYSGTFAVAGA